MSKRYAVQEIRGFVAGDKYYNVVPVEDGIIGNEHIAQFYGDAGAKKLVLEYAQWKNAGQPVDPKAVERGMVAVAYIDDKVERLVSERIDRFRADVRVAIAPCMDEIERQLYNENWDDVKGSLRHRVAIREIYTILEKVFKA